MVKTILILRDSRTGNFRQAQTVAGIAADCLRKRNDEGRIEVLNVEYRNAAAKAALIACSIVPAPAGLCRWGLKSFLKPEVYGELERRRPDLVISGGSAVAPVNVLFCAATGARSVTVMRPSWVGLGRFDLAFVPRHDNPPRNGNIVVTEGALNAIDPAAPRRRAARGEVIGVLIGGTAGGFHLAAAAVTQVIAEVKKASRETDAAIMLSTSRRTPPGIEEVVRKELAGFGRCRLCVIANERNPAGTVETILDSSNSLIVSPESVMMISEAVNSRKRVFVFESPGLDRRHRKFLSGFAEKGYIRLVKPSSLAAALRDAGTRAPEQPAFPPDRMLAARALEKIL